jgi:predicted deacylase
MVTVHALIVDDPQHPSTTPCLDLGSADRGPTVALIAGVHGCEYAAMAGLRSFLTGLDEAALRGRLLVVPIANLPAFEQRTAFVGPHDAKNLNRCFPGDPGGTFTDRLAHALFQSVVRPADFLIDLHSGDQVEDLVPFALYDEGPAEAAAREMAEAYGLPYVIRTARGDSPIAGTSSAAAAALGRPAITAEAGGRGLIEQAAVQAHVDGLRRVLDRLGVLPDAAAPPPPRPPTTLAQFRWLTSPAAGWWEPAVSVGDAVAAGQLLGAVRSLQSNARLADVHSPAAGVPVFITISPAVAEGGLLLGLGVPPPAAQPPTAEATGTAHDPATRPEPAP